MPKRKIRARDLDRLDEIYNIFIEHPDVGSTSLVLGFSYVDGKKRKGVNELELFLMTKEGKEWKSIIPEGNPLELVRSVTFIDSNEWPVVNYEIHREYVKGSKAILPTHEPGKFIASTAKIAEKLSATQADSLLKLLGAK